MYLSRKSVLSLALVVGLLGGPTLASAHAPGAPGGVMHPPVALLATADAATGRRRRARRAKVHAIRRRLTRVLRRAVNRIRATDASHHARRPPHDWVARGPPRSLGL